MRFPESIASVEQTGADTVDTIRRYALIVWRNKWVIAGAIALSLILAWGYLLIATKYYQAQALIVVEDRKGIDDVINRGENADEHFEKRLFVIQKQINSIAYRLELLVDMKVHSVFHVSLLEPYRESTFLRRVQSPPPSIEIENHEEYEIEKILDSR